MSWGLIGVATLWVAGLVAFVCVVANYSDMDAPQADAIVVLTGGPGRVVRGLELFADGQAEDVFISGVYETVGMDDIRTQTSRVLPDCCITLGYEATTTIGNAEEVTKWLRSAEARSIILVTSNYHMPRALLEMRQLRDDGLQIHPSVVLPVRGQHSLSDYMKLSLSEYHKYWYRRAVLGLSGA